MKNSPLKPGFEFIFAMSLIAIIGLPPIVFAQNTKIKDIDIRITNGDTTVNGKNIKDLSPEQRKDALKDIQNLNGDDKPMAGNQRFYIRRGGSSDTGRNVVIERRRFNNGDRGFAFRGDSMHTFQFRYKAPGGKDSMMTYNFRMNPDLRMEPREFEFRNRDFNFNMRPMRGMEFRMNRRNSQHFSYSTTGSDGMITNVNFMVSDASPERIKQLTGSQKADLELSDLSLVPEFTSGKTLLMFSLPAHTAADVKFMDHDGKVLWTDKSMNGSFSKSFPLGLNGSYLLEVRQGGKAALKRIVKEE
ncbi:MAG TPA: hypothetical protein VG367_11625 [Mucilaginibacter sp.]|jgi:hypothetical protein|nr:hypothetical protein [Mucilaginibacter sp.]